MAVKGLAMEISKNSMMVVMASFLSNRSRANFAWAALNIPNGGQRWFYATINPASPHIVDYAMQIMSEEALETFFEFGELYAQSGYWFEIELKENSNG